jgi:hypothetical protein
MPRSVVPSRVRIRRLEYWIVGAIALLLLVLLFNINAVRRLTYTRFPELRRPLNEALHNAARKGDLERAAFLLERGADVNAEIGFTTPLMEAVSTTTSIRATAFESWRQSKFQGLRPSGHLSPTA